MNAEITIFIVDDSFTAKKEEKQMLIKMNFQFYINSLLSIFDFNFKKPII